MFCFKPKFRCITSWKNQEIAQLTTKYPQVFFRRWFTTIRQSGLHQFKIQPVSGDKKRFLEVALQLEGDSQNQKFEIYILLIKNGEPIIRNSYEIQRSSRGKQAKHTELVLNDIAGQGVDALRDNATWDDQARERFERTAKKLVVIDEDAMRKSTSKTIARNILSAFSKAIG